jgi:ribosome-binding factor A
MPEFRARTYHRNRVQETLREEISTMIDGELSDPRIGTAHVTEVVMAPGGKSARVLVAVEGGDAEKEDETLAGLLAARGYMRRELLARMGVRHVPELTFVIDRSDRMQGRIDELLGRAEKRRRKE